MSSPTADPLIGQLLAGRYRVLKKLGEGAMGAVYLAEHIRMGRKDAIKVLRDNLAADREAILRFERGARNVSAIRHTNVCTIYDFTDTDEGLRFLAMEYVEGPTLKELLEAEGTLPLDRAVDIACQVAAGLDAAHDCGIVHRDLKPGNIMLVRGKGGTDVVKVVDFDIAKGPEGGEEVTRLGFVIGTPEYMSPEQLMGEPLDGRSDIYSLALVLIRMLTGVLPFRAEGTQDLMIARLTSQPLTIADLRPDLRVPPALQQALDRALQRKPADRQGDALEFARDIRAALSSGAAPARPPQTVPAPAAGFREGAVPETRAGPAGSVTGKASSPAPKRNVVLWGGVALGAIAMAGVSWALLSGGDPTSDARIPVPPPVAGGDPPVDSGTASDPGSTTATPPPSPPPAPPPSPPPAPPPSPPPVAEPGIRFASAAEIDAVLLRMNDRVLGSVEPPAAELPAIRDTLLAAREQAVNDEQRRAAATQLAFVASYRNDAAGCRRWADEVSRLGGDGAQLRAQCPAQDP